MINTQHESRFGLSLSFLCPRDLSCQAYHVRQKVCHVGLLCHQTLMTGAQLGGIKVQDEDLAAGRHQDVALVQVAMQHARLMDQVHCIRHFVDEGFVGPRIPLPSSALQTKNELKHTNNVVQRRNNDDQRIGPESSKCRSTNSFPCWKTVFMSAPVAPLPANFMEHPCSGHQGVCSREELQRLIVVCRRNCRRILTWNDCASRRHASNFQQPLSGATGPLEHFIAITMLT